MRHYHIYYYLRVNTEERGGWMNGMGCLHVYGEFVALCSPDGMDGDGNGQGC